MTPPPDAGAADLGRFRNYLVLLARLRLDPLLRGNLDASDVVQQTLLEAHQALAGFRGTTDGERAAWLRQILARNLANAVRDFARGKRDVARERSLAAAVDESSAQLAGWLADDQSSPSQRVLCHERALLLADALTRLVPAQRKAVVLRHWQGWSLEAIAGQLGCSTAAVTGLLHRGLRNLRKQLHELE